MLQTSSPYFNQPFQLAKVHPSLTFTSQVGELEDAKLFSVPKAIWEQDGVKDDIFSKLLGETGVRSVDVLPEPVKRSKRGEL